LPAKSPYHALGLTYLVRFSALGFLCTTLCSAGVIALVASLTGIRLLQLLNVSFANLAEEIGFSVGMGLGVISLVVFFLGLMDCLRPLWLLSVFAAISLASAVSWRNIGGRIRKGSDFIWRNGLLVLLFVLLFLPLWLLSLYPPTASDSITYHLAAAKLYGTTGSLTPTPQLRYAVFPQNSEMLFAAALSLGTEGSAQMMSLLFLLSTVAAVGGYLLRSEGLLASLVGLGLLLSNSLVLELGHIAYADMALTAFVTLALLGFLRWLDSGERPWIILTGTMAGFAAGSKYSALFFVASLLVLTSVIAVRQRSPKVFLLYCLSCAVCGLPWYVYNWINAGNPVWPFLSSVFTLRYWSASDLQGQLVDLLAAYGTGKTLFSFIALPWNIFAHPDRFSAAGTLSFTLALSIPFAGYALFRSVSMRWLGIVSSAYVLFWFLTAQILRYLIPVVPAVCVLGATGVARLLHAKVRDGSGISLSAGLALGLLAAVPGWWYTITQTGVAGPLPLGASARNDYLSRRLTSYGAVRFVNASAGSGFTLYSYHDPRMAFFTDGRFRGDFYGPWRYSTIDSVINGPELSLLRQLRNMEANYLLIRDDAQGSGFKREWSSWKFILPVYRAPGVVLFQVSESPRNVRFGPELVPPELVAGNPTMAGGVRISVVADSLYVCNAIGTTPSDPVVAVLRVEWMKGDGTIARGDEAMGVFLPEGETVTLLGSPPPGTISAHITCTPLGDGECAIRSLTFHRLYYVSGDSSSDPPSMSSPSE
jgi:hypothetical protein